MGGQQVKASPSPFLFVESCTLTTNNERERPFPKHLPRRLGGMQLARWVLLKRDEKRLIHKIKEAVASGKAPPTLLKQVEMHVAREAKEGKKFRVKYHPKVFIRKCKPRPRLRPPKMTQTAARRIQQALDRRKHENQQQESAASTPGGRRPSKSQLSLKSQGWTGKRSARSQRNVQGGGRASPLPPTSCLSLQSITTAESSGIGLSRTSSITSVASDARNTGDARNNGDARKAFYNRYRARSLDPSEESVWERRHLRSGKVKASSTDSLHHQQRGAARTQKSRTQSGQNKEEGGSRPRTQKSRTPSRKGVQQPETPKILISRTPSAHGKEGDSRPRTQRSRTSSGRGKQEEDIKPKTQRSRTSSGQSKQEGDGRPRTQKSGTPSGQRKQEAETSRRRRSSTSIGDKELRIQHTPEQDSRQKKRSPVRDSIKKSPSPKQQSMLRVEQQTYLYKQEIHHSAEDDEEQQRPPPHLRKNFQAILVQEPTLERQSMKKDQGSQTRMSGPPKPRRSIFSFRKNRVKNVQETDDRPTSTTEKRPSSNPLPFVAHKNETNNQKNKEGNDESPVKPARRWSKAILCVKAQKKHHSPSLTHKSMHDQVRAIEYPRRASSVGVQADVSEMASHQEMAGNSEMASHPEMTSHPAEESQVTPVTQVQERPRSQQQLEDNISQDVALQDVVSDGALTQISHEAEVHHVMNDDQRPYLLPAQTALSTVIHEDISAHQRHIVIRPERSPIQNLQDRGTNVDFDDNEPVEVVQRHERQIVDGRPNMDFMSIVPEREDAPVAVRRSPRPLEHSHSVETVGTRRPAEVILERSSSLDSQSVITPRRPLDQGRSVAPQGSRRRMQALPPRGRSLDPANRRLSSRSLERARHPALQDREYVIQTSERRIRRLPIEAGPPNPSMNRGRLARRQQSVEVLYDDAVLDNVNVRPRRMPQAYIIDRSLESTGRSTPVEGVLREIPIDYIHQDSAERLRPDVIVDQARYEQSYGAAPGTSLRLYNDRDYSVERGYYSETSEPRYVHAPAIRRFDPPLIGSYSERGHLRPVDEPYYSRALVEPYRRPFEIVTTMDADYGRTFSENRYSRRPVELDREPIQNGMRRKGAMGWEERGRYRAALAPLRDSTSFPSRTQRAL